MNPDLLSILQHSLGLDQYGQGRKPYRNYFLTDPDYHDGIQCRTLVTLGYMTERPTSEIFGGMSHFAVTPLGIEAVQTHSPKPPKLTRSQKRYRQFLASDTSMSFREWLDTPYARVAVI